ncbi:hypothetical protein [Bacteroides sp.]
MVTTTIEVKPYLAAYMYVRYQANVIQEFNAIKLTSTENLYHVIKNLTVKRPRNVSWRETGNLTIVIPDPRYGKDPETYNYLGHDSIICIEGEIEIMLKVELHSLMLKNKFQKGIMYKKSLLWFMETYHIEDKYEDALMKAFQRWKKKRVE